MKNINVLKMITCILIVIFLIMVAILNYCNLMPIDNNEPGFIEDVINEPLYCSALLVYMFLSVKNIYYSIRESEYLSIHYVAITFLLILILGATKELIESFYKLESVLNIIYGAFIIPLFFLIIFSVLLYFKENIYYEGKKYKRYIVLFCMIVILNYLIFTFESNDSTSFNSYFMNSMITAINTGVVLKFLFNEFTELKQK